MEAEKVNGVLSWSQQKNVKDVRKFLGYQQLKFDDQN